MLSPSSRLRLMLALAFEGNVGITRPTGANTWTLTPFVKTGITPSDTGTAAGGGLPDIFTGRQLPDAWEFDTAADDLRGTADFNAVGGYSLSGSGPWYWMLTARWEPNTSIEPAELERLYSLCSLQAPQPIVVST